MYKKQSLPSKYTKIDSDFECEDDAEDFRRHLESFNYLPKKLQPAMYYVHAKPGYNEHQAAVGPS